MLPLTVHSSGSAWKTTIVFCLINAAFYLLTSLARFYSENSPTHGHLSKLLCKLIHIICYNSEFLQMLEAFFSLNEIVFYPNFLFVCFCCSVTVDWQNICTYHLQSNLIWVKLEKLSKFYNLLNTFCSDGWIGESLVIAFRCRMFFNPHQIGSEQILGWHMIGSSHWNDNELVTLRE